MGTPPAASAAPAAQTPLKVSAYAWALGLVTALDYFDNSLFSYFASYIAGGINASQDELIWSSSSYAVAAVLGILQQQWWVDRLGHKRYIAGCMFLYALAGLLSGFADTSFELMLTRAAQGYFVGPMMGACRILLQDGGFPPSARGPGRQLFLKSIVLATALAPLAGGLLLAHFQWRALFFCTVPVGLALGAFVLYAVPDHGRLAPDDADDSGSHLWPYLAFAVSQGALQIVLQQLHFQLFTSSILLGALLLLAVAGLAYFAHHQWHHPRPLVQLRGLGQRTYVMGLLLYSFYYYLSTTFGYLIQRFLESGLGYPVDTAGWFVGTTSLVSFAMLFAYFKYSSRVPRKKWLIVPGFVLAAVATGYMTFMTPQVSQSQLLAPLILRGMLLMFIAVPVANLTFRLFSLDEFSHSYRFKNIVRQLVISFATSSIIIVERHREALHYSRLAEVINPFNPTAEGLIERLTASAMAAGHSAAQAHTLALSQLSRIVTQQANFLSVLDGFAFLTLVAVVGAAIALWQKEIN